MTKNQQLANRLQEVLLNGTWIANTNYYDQLHNLSIETATSKIGSHNSISVLAQHIHYYINGIKDVFLGLPLSIKDQFSFDFPPMTTQEQWNEFLQKFCKDSEELIQLIENFPEEQLSNAFFDEKYGDYTRNIDGLIEHAYYHLGQIVLLKKLIST